MAAAAACSSAPALRGNPHFAAETVTITAGGLLPGSDVHIAHFGTVVFRNELPSGDAEVELARAFRPSADCSTTVGFRAMGDESQAQAIPPRGLAAICFHDLGEFPFVVRTPQGEYQGRVVVEEGR